MKSVFLLPVILGICLAVSTARLSAQADPESKGPTPKQPLLARAPEMSSWTITFTPSKAASDAAAAKPVKQQEPLPQITSVHVEKTDKTYHRIVTVSTGVTLESWTVQGKQLLQLPSNPTLLRIANGPLFDDYSQTDFEELSWLNIKYYTGNKKAGTKILFNFTASNRDRPRTRLETLQQTLATSVAPGVSTTAAQLKTMRKQAAEKYLEATYGATSSTVMLDSDNQLPMQYDDGKVVRTYQFGAAPSGPIELPDPVKQEFAKWAREPGVSHP